MVKQSDSAFFFLFDLLLDKLKSVYLFLVEELKVRKFKEGEHIISYTKEKCKMHFHVLLRDWKTYQYSHLLY